MSIQTGLIAELKHEAAATKRLLEKVPAENNTWKPHEKSMALGRLATHIAETPQWITRILAADEFDFSAHRFTPVIAATNEELLTIFQTNIDAATASLEAATLDTFDKTWTVKSGGTIYYQLPKKVAIRGWACSHLYHHRGQLTVYLRLLNIPVPGMYGPSADEGM